MLVCRCHHIVARPQVADGGAAIRYGGLLRIYLTSCRGQSTRGSLLARGLGEMLTPLLRKKHGKLQNSLVDLSFGLIF